MKIYKQTSTSNNKFELTYVTAEIRVTQYKKTKNPIVEKTVLVGKVLNSIKNGDEHISLINKAREIGKGNEGYDFIKTNKLPTFRFNFIFKDKASNRNIVSPTGLIYIDYDYVESIPENEYIYAKWKSLSNLGYGVLVKIDNLTQANFKEAYNTISKLIVPNIEPDKNACKATQQTILSFDSELYLNTNSIIYHYEESKKVSLVNIIEREERGIVTNDTFLKDNNYSFGAINYSNIGDYFTDENSTLPYIPFLEDKAKICQPFIPKNIKEGSRNSTMFSVLSSFAMLNPNCGKGLLKMFSSHLNGRMSPKLPDKEVNCIIDNVLRRRENGELEVYLNKERRVLFNPFVTISRQEKYQIVGSINGFVRKEKTRQIIYETLENWDFKKEGKIIQKKVAKLANKSLPTVKKYWSEFKNYVEELNRFF